MLNAAFAHTCQLACALSPQLQQQQQPRTHSLPGNGAAALRQPGFIVNQIAAAAVQGATIISSSCSCSVPSALNCPQRCCSAPSALMLRTSAQCPRRSSQCPPTAAQCPHHCCSMPSPLLLSALSTAAQRCASPSWLPAVPVLSRAAAAASCATALLSPLQTQNMTEEKLRHSYKNPAMMAGTGSSCIRGLHEQCVTEMTTGSIPGHACCRPTAADTMPRCYRHSGYRI